MANCETKKIDSNVVGLRYCQEDCLGVLPSNQKWFELEPNSYSDFGGELTTVSRTPISVSRQNKKGTVTDLSVKGGFNIDFTQNNLTDLMQGLFFADMRAKKSIATTGSETTGFTVAKDGTTFVEGDLVLAKGFATQSLNTVHTVGTGSTATNIAVTGLERHVERATLTQVGFQFASGDLKFEVTNGVYKLKSTNKTLTDLGLIVGEWIFVGGQESTNQFANVPPFYGRIGSIKAKEIVFDNGTFKSGLSTDNGSGRAIQMYFGTVIKNENTPEKIVRRSYTLERTLGQNTSTKKDQAEYISGAVLGEFSLNLSQGEMLSADLTFTATNSEYRTGTLLSNGKLTSALGEEGINTVHDIRSIRLSLVDENVSTSTPLFGYVTEMSLEVNNNLSENKAIGVFGAVDISAGNFEVTGSTTAYFSTIEASQAVRDYKDCELHAIIAKSNAGFIFDIPLLGLGGGQSEVEKDEAVTISLDTSGAENKNGYTLMYVNFPYLPTVAM